MQPQGEKKIPYTLRKGNNRTDAVKNNVKKKQVPKQGGWGKRLKITSRGGTQGAPRTELNPEIIGAPQRVHSTVEWKP